MLTDRISAKCFARALLSGPFEEASLLERAVASVRGPRRWVRSCVARLLGAWDGETRPTQRWVVDFLLRDARFLRHAANVCVQGGASIAPAMAPAPGAPSTWNVPALTTPAALAAWLNVSLDELTARADGAGREAKAPEGPSRNYHYSWRGKRSGSARLIEAPKPRLKKLQRRVLEGILDFIPPHEAARGFRRGSSVTAFIAPHVGKQIVLRLDLQNFFPSIRGRQVHAIFYTAGYPEAVAKLLAGLCWNAAPDEVWLDFPGTIPADLSQLPIARRYRDPHLPQGAPTSPALANLCAFRMDRRLAGLAREAGAVYTRYADDLVFSGGEFFARRASPFVSHVSAIVQDEGFAVHPRKTRIMRQGVQQRAAGVVLNSRLNTPRRDYERLKAILHQSWRDAPAPPPGMSLEMYRFHLMGRIAWTASLNPSRGEKLRAMFGKIQW